MTIRKPGQLFGLYLVLYSIGRFIVEFWRIDTWSLGPLKIAHLLSVAAFVIGFWFLTRKQVLDTP